MTSSTSCAGAATIFPRPSPPSVGAEAPRAAEPTAPDRNVAVGSHGEYVPTLTAAAARCVNAAVSKAAWWPWPLTFWPWKWWLSWSPRPITFCTGAAVAVAARTPWVGFRSVTCQSLSGDVVASPAGLSPPPRDLSTNTCKTAEHGNGKFHTSSGTDWSCFVPRLNS